MADSTPKEATFSFWKSHLARKTIVRTFLSVFFIQLLFLYPFSAYFGKLQLDNIEQEGLAMTRTLFTTLTDTAKSEDLLRPLNTLLTTSRLRGFILLTPDDSARLLRVGLKPAAPMNNLPKWNFLFTPLTSEHGQYYDVFWDDQIHHIPYDVMARFDVSDIAFKTQLFALLILGAMVLSSLIVSSIIFFIFRNTLFKPLFNLNYRLTRILERPAHMEKWITARFSSFEFENIEKQLNNLIQRLLDIQKTFKAHEAVLEMRVEERTKELLQLVNYNIVTDLPNRNLLKERLKEFIRQAREDNKKVALLTLLLVDFHEINHAFGTAIGDLFLREAARNLSENAPGGACIAHVSTSQFTIAKGGLLGTHHVANLAQWMLDMFAKPITINDQNISTTVNIGIAIFPLDGEDPEVLMNNANMALNRAKNASPNSYQFYEANMDKLIEARRSMLVDLHYALEKNQLVAYYQPQVDLNTNKIIGVEALIRWIHPDKGLVPPDLFIPLAEESGLIIEMGEWILREACLQTLKWEAEGLPKLLIAVNLSGVQFKQENIVEVVNRILIETGLPQNQLELEITESTIMNDIQRAIYTMKALLGLGVSLAMDDFGTGYSSLNYLRQFPIQKLKVDQSFVRDIQVDHDTQEKPLADIILLLAKSLNLHTIAEGIETEAIAEYLRSKGCQEGQGYLYGKPMPADQITALFKND